MHATICAHLKATFPHLTSFSDLLQDDPSGAVTECRAWRVVPFKRRQFLVSALKYIAAQPTLHDILDQLYSGNTTRDIKTVQTCYDPYTILTTEITADLIATLPDHQTETSLSNPKGDRTEQQYRLSARLRCDSVSLTSPNSLRSHARDIMLLEDHVAIAWPESHVQRLIPCLQGESHFTYLTSHERMAQ
jgi:hypothetical protein